MQPLPLEVVVCILRMLPMSDLLQCSLVCKQWRRACHEQVPVSLRMSSQGVRRLFKTRSSKKAREERQARQKGGPAGKPLAPPDVSYEAFVAALARWKWVVELNCREEGAKLVRAMTEIHAQAQAAPQVAAEEDEGAGGDGGESSDDDHQRDRVALSFPVLEALLLTGLQSPHLPPLGSCCTTLATLDLTHAVVSTLEPLRACTALRWLSIRRTQHIPDMVAIPTLEYLNAGFSKLNTMASIALCPALRTLRLYRVYDIAAAPADALAQLAALKHIERVTLPPMVVRLGGAALHTLVQAWPALVHLHAPDLHDDWEMQAEDNRTLPRLDVKAVVAYDAVPGLVEDFN